MDLNNKTLDAWLKDAPVDAYRLGKKVDYYSLYIALKEYLERNVHSQVTLGAHLKDPDILINDHGTQHIETVIEKVTDLVCSADCKLSALEVYILLLCIQLHDVGNIFGRYDHEMNVDKIILEAENLCGRDTVEVMTVRSIAQAHGGEVRNSKDKISLLNENEPLLDGVIRAQAIASLLRFADELSDDKRRASTKLLKENKIPKKSEVFHAYASCLDVVSINHKEKAVELYFKIPKEFATRHFGKINEEILLLDEIYNRVIKMHLERMYCMRFLKGIIDLEKIAVFIEFYDKFFGVFRPISFEISESGYPSASADGIYSLCPSLIDETGNKINGEYVKNRIIGA